MAEWNGKLADLPVHDVWGNQQGTLSDYPTIMNQFYGVVNRKLPVVGKEKPVAMNIPKSWSNIGSHNWNEDISLKVDGLDKRTEPETEEQNDKTIPLYVQRARELHAEQKKQGFWERLCKTCESRGVQVADLPNLTNVTELTVSGWATGVLPKLNNLVKLSNALNVSMDYLMFGTEKQYLTEAKEKTVEPKQTADTSKFVGDEQFYQRMRGLAGIESSKRTRNIEMAKLMCRLLKEMGYGKATDLFEKVVFSDNQ